MSVSRLLARPMLSSMFLVGGYNALRHTEQTAERAKPVTDRVVPLARRVAPGAPIPQDMKTLVRINAGAQILGAIGLATGKAPRASAALLAATLIPTTAAGHRFWEESDPMQKTNQRIHFFKNVSMLGGLLIAAGDTDGKPGLVWRAQHLTSHAKKSGRRAARSARREAKLARAKVS